MSGKLKSNDLAKQREIQDKPSRQMANPRGISLKWKPKSIQNYITAKTTGHSNLKVHTLGLEAGLGTSQLLRGTTTFAQDSLYFI